jgi:hypothetical protein
VRRSDVKNATESRCHLHDYGRKLVRAIADARRRRPAPDRPRGPRQDPCGRRTSLVNVGESERLEGGVRRQWPVAAGSEGRFTTLERGHRASVVGVPGEFHIRIPPLDARPGVRRRPTDRGSRCETVLPDPWQRSDDRNELPAVHIEDQHHRPVIELRAPGRHRTLHRPILAVRPGQSNTLNLNSTRSRHGA